MRAFIDTLREVRDGQLVVELAPQLEQVIEAVQATGKKGKLLLTLELAPAKGNMYVLTDSVKLTLPEPEKDTSTVFFVTDERELSRRDPRQPKLPELGPREVVPLRPAAEGLE